MPIWDEIKDSFKSNNMLIKLIYINIGAFLVINIVNVIFFLFKAQSPLITWLALPTHFQALLFKPWTFITYMFTHEDFFHILFNMIFLYFGGRIFLQFLDEKKLLSTYILGGLAGGLLFMLSYNFFPIFGEAVYGARIIGASASVMAVFFAVTALVPNFSVLLPFLGSVKLKYIAIFYFILDVASIAQSNPGGHIAHIGGALYGIIYVIQYRKGKDHSNWFGNIFDKISGLFKSNHKRPKVRVVHKRKLTDDEYNEQKVATQEEIDRILDKIKASGYDSLTKEEKDTLFRASEE